MNTEAINHPRVVPAGAAHDAVRSMKRPRIWAAMICVALFCAFLFLAAPGGAAWAQSARGAKTAAAKPGGDNPVLARVNGKAITLADVYKQIESLSLGDQINVRDQIDRFTDSIVTEEVLFQSVLAGGLAADDGLRGKIRTQVVEYLIDKHVRGKIKVTDEPIRRYYAENRDVVRGLHVRVRQIQLKARAQCEQVQKRIRGDKDFVREAKALSLDKRSAAQGGDMGYQMPVAERRTLGFEGEFFKMKLGEMRVFESPAGCHLVRVTEIIDPPDPTFARIKEYVLPILEREQERALLQQLIERASKTVTVERFGAAAR